MIHAQNRCKYMCSRCVNGQESPKRPKRCNRHGIPKMTCCCQKCGPFNIVVIVVVVAFVVVVVVVLVLIWFAQILAGLEYLFRRTEYSWYLTLIAPVGAAVYAGQFAMGFMGKRKAAEEAEAADVDPELLKKQQRRQARKEKGTRIKYSR